MTQKRFSREKGFTQLDASRSMTNPNDATIDIPLSTVQTSSQTGARKAANDDGYRQSRELTNEKMGHHKKPMAGRRKKLVDRGREQKDSDDGTLNTMGKIYTKILNFSVITRYFLYVLPLASCIAVLIVLGATVAKKAQIGGVRIVWFFTWVEIVWLGLWIAKLFAQFLPFVFQFLCGIVSSGTRKYSLILIALEIPLSLVFWAIICLTTFVPMMTLNPDNRNQPNGKTLKAWESICKNILFACLCSTLILLAEKLLIQLISISYHRKQFDLKIQDSKRNIYLLGLLYDASRALFPAYCPEFAAEDYVINDSLELLGSKAGSHKKSGSATPMRLIQNVGRVGDKVTAAFGNIAQEVTGKQVFNPTGAHSIVVEALEKTKSSEALARRLWMSFVMEGRDALYEDDLHDVLGPERAIEAEEIFAALDRDGNGDISLDEMILVACEFGRERHSIANSMHDVDQAIHVLDNLLCIVVFILVIFLFVAWLNSSFTTTLATAGTALLSLSFVFAATAQEVLGSCIFLFVKHPYDVGDRIDVNEKQMTVERISLLYTVFRKVADHKTVQVPNIVLNSTWVENITRSKAMREQLSMFINFDTTFEDIQLLKNEMSIFVNAKENIRDYQPDVDIEVIGIAEMNKMELRIEIKHKSNWANEAVRAARRSKFMCALVLALRKVPVYAPGGGDAVLGDLAKPTYSVAISHEQAQASKDDFAATKDAKRMVAAATATQIDGPASSTKDVGKSSSIEYLGSTVSRSEHAKEIATMQVLNTRSPALDPAHDDSQAYYEDRQEAEDLAKTDSNRSNQIEEVRGLLRKESTTGRRKAAGTMPGSSMGQFPTIQEPISPPRGSESRSKPIAYQGYGYNEAGPPNMTALPQPVTYPSTNPYVRPRADSATQRKPLPGHPNSQR